MQVKLFRSLESHYDRLNSLQFHSTKSKICTSFFLDFSTLFKLRLASFSFSNHLDASIDQPYRSRFPSQLRKFPESRVFMKTRRIPWRWTLPRLSFRSRSLFSCQFANRSDREAREERRSRAVSRVHECKAWINSETTKCSETAAISRWNESLRYCSRYRSGTGPRGSFKQIMTSAPTSSIGEHNWQAFFSCVRVCWFFFFYIPPFFHSAAIIRRNGRASCQESLNFHSCGNEWRERFTLPRACAVSFAGGVYC